MVQEQIAFANRGEDVGLAEQPLRNGRRERGVVQVGAIEVDDRP
jgi:hypothetical protein